MNADVPRRAAGKKPRWTTAQKLARAKAERGARGTREARGASERPRDARSGRPSREARFERDAVDRAGGGRRADRPDRAGRARDGAPTRWERQDRSERPPRADAPVRRGRREDWSTTPPRGRDDRGDRGDRFVRGDRPGRDDTRAPRRTDWEGRGPAERRTGRESWTDRDDRRGGWQPRTDRDDRRTGRESRTDRDDRGRPQWEPRPRADRAWEPRGPRRHEGRRPDHHAQALVRRERPPRDDRDRAGRFDRSGGEPTPVATVDSGNGFLAAGLPMPLVQRLLAQGIETPFPIQAATLPDALAGRDVLGRGQTGSGKTLAFGLPLIARLMEEPKAAAKKPLAVVLVPTRELAIQVTRALEPLAKAVGLRHQLVAGGLSYTPQIAALEHGVEVLVATPGRLVDLMEKDAADLSDVRIAVLDEADHMAEMGFVPEVTAILDAIPAGGQRLLFSATLDRGVDRIVETYLDDPVTHSTDDVTAAVTTMEHHILLVEPPHKKLVTAEVANRGGRTLVFTRTKLGAERVAEQLREQGVFAAALHGGLNQRVRGRILAAFTDGVLPVLVATDVAARGIHVEGIELVLQIDPPADHKDYLHRAGRTARAGDRGIVVTLALPHQSKPMQRLAREAGVEVVAVPAGPGRRGGGGAPGPPPAAPPAGPGR